MNIELVHVVINKGFISGTDTVIDATAVEKAFKHSSTREACSPEHALKQMHVNTPAHGFKYG